MGNQKYMKNIYNKVIVKKSHLVESDKRTCKYQTTKSNNLMRNVGHLLFKAYDM